MDDVRAQILVVEDDPDLRQGIRGALEGLCYRCLEAANGREGMDLVASHRPDVILLDLGLPDMDGLELLSRLREWSRTPVLVLSARGRDIDKVASFDSGADDYLTKPFRIPELLARIRTLLRRAGPDRVELSVFVLDHWRIDLPLRKVWVDDREVRLSTFEFAVLGALIRRAGSVVTHRQLLDEVWGGARSEWLSHLRLCMTQLRRKLEQNPSRPRHLRTETGVGYRLWVGASS